MNPGIRIGRAVAYRVLCALVVWGASGCRAAPAAPVTLTFAFPKLEYPLYERAAKEFMQANPHITIQLAPRTWEQLRSLTAEEMDVALVSDYELDSLRQAKSIRSLGALLEQDRHFQAADLVTGTLAQCTREGQVWGIPTQLDPLVMYYNQDFLDARKVPYPQADWTWDEFLATARACTDAEAGVYGYVYAPGGFEPVPFIYQHGGRIFDDWQNPGRTTFDDARTIEALEWYTDLVRVHKVAPPYAEAMYYLARGVYAGKVAMWVATVSASQEWTWNTRWGMVPLPRDKQAATLFFVEALVISAETQSADAGWQWLTFLGRKASGSAVPARRSVMASEAYAQQVGAQRAAVARAAAESGMLYAGQTRDAHSAAWEALLEACEAMLREEMTPRQAMERAQAGR